MLNKLKAFIKKQKAAMEVYGDEGSRTTFKGDLNYQAGKLCFVIYVTIIAWLPYIISDRGMHQFPNFVTVIRLLLTVLSLILILLKNGALSYNPGVILLIIMTYLCFGTSLITATAGDNITSYIGGYTFVLMLPVVAPIQLKYKAIVSALSLGLFFFVGTRVGVDFTEAGITYASTDLLIAFCVSLLLSYSLDIMRIQAWERQQSLNEMVDEQKKNLKTISELAAKAEAASDTKGKFLARMSHELRTPMNAIIGITEIVLRENTTSEMTPYMIGIKSAGNNLLSIISDILDISKIESGKLEILETSYSFEDMVNEVFDIIRVKVVEKSLTFVAFIDNNIPENLIGDATRVRQVLLNILSNAVKYTQSGFVSISFTTEYITETNFILKVDVADSGIGIKSDDMDKLFGDFIQVDIMAHKDIQGTGLGLAITKGLCMAMGGDVTAISQHGLGSTFTIRIPQRFEQFKKLVVINDAKDIRVLIYEIDQKSMDFCLRSFNNLRIECRFEYRKDKFIERLLNGTFTHIFLSVSLYYDVKPIIEPYLNLLKVFVLTEYGDTLIDKNIHTITKPITILSIAQALNGIEAEEADQNALYHEVTFTAPAARVLIVDDIATNLMVAEGLMKPYKMEVDVCTSGKLAIKAVQKNKYDIIFMDHMMPEMDGIAAVKIIRELPNDYYRTVPIIALTANAVSGMRDTFILSGMNDFLAKPISTPKLSNVLEHWLPKDKIQIIERSLGETDGAADNKPAVNPPFSIDGVNVEIGMASTGGSADNYKKVLKVLISDIESRLTNIDECVKEKNAKLFTTQVHALKSALRSIGAIDLSNIAEKLEVAGNKNDFEYIEKKTAGFTEGLKGLAENIGKVLLSKSEDDTDAETLDKTLLSQLRQALDTMDVSQIDAILKELQSKRYIDDINSAIEKISQDILMFEYDDAHSEIEHLLVS